MRFTWTGLIVAPLLAPLLFCTAMLILSESGNPLVMFLFLMLVGCIVSYGATIFLLLPSLFLFSLWRPLNGLTVCLLGFALGAATFVPMTLMEWKSSGPDSGPPTEPLFSFFLRWAADPLNAIYPLAGLVTAGLYWWLGSRRRGRGRAASPTFPAA